MPHVRRYAAPLAVVLLCLAGVAPPAAGAETLWSFVPAADATTIEGHLAAGYSVTELETEPTSSDRFAAIFERRASDPGTWWYRELTSEEVQAKLAEHGARLTHLDVSGKSGSARYAAVMVDNTGPAAVRWWWWIGPPAELAAKAAELGARVIDLERQPDDLVSAIMVDNSTSGAATWVYVGVTPADIDGLLAANRARLIDIEPVTDGVYDVSMLASSRTSWWYAGKSSDELIALASQNGARLVDVEPYESAAGTVYAAIMVTNVSAETTRVNELLRSAVADTGAWGLYLKRVRGRQLSAINAQRPFEPASMIKVLYHLRTVHAFQSNLRALDRRELTWYQGMSGSCPVATSPTEEPISVVLRRMMQYSDNRATQAVVANFGGFAGMTEFAASVGATNTAVNHDIGCPEGAFTSPNRLTLADAGLLYERAATRSVLSREAFKKFRQLMATNRPGRVDAIVKGRRAGGGHEAVQGLARHLRLPTWRADDFLSRVRIAWKGGSYILCTPTCRYDWTLAAWISVPFKRPSGRIVRQSYVFGMFTEDTPAEARAARAWDRGPEVLRPVLKKALRSWKRARR